MLRGRRHLFEGGLLSNSAKGLEWPVVIPINTTTELYRSDQFVHRQSDNSLHWMLGGIAPPDLAAARVQDSEEEARQSRSGKFLSLMNRM